MECNTAEYNNVVQVQEVGSGASDDDEGLCSEGKGACLTSFRSPLGLPARQFAIDQQIN